MGNLVGGLIQQAGGVGGLLDMLRKGTTALFYVYQTPDDGFGIPVSLNGFGAGFDALP